MQLILQHRQLTRPFFHHSHVSPGTFRPSLERFLTLLPPPSGRPIDVQALNGQLALNVAISWMCGEDIGAMEPVSPKDVESASEWRKSCMELPVALAQAQRAVGRRVKIGTLWVCWGLFYSHCADATATFRVIRQSIDSTYADYQGFFWTSHRSRA